MATISKIEIEGFKAFPKYFSLDFGDKNLLMYGENGSGKSSIYHALHALLQSVFKDDKGAKYFKVVEDSSTGEGSIPNNENLINISRTNEARDGSFRPYIKITLDNGHIWELDRGGLQINGGDDSEIRMMNKDAVFINHSYISRFRSARNSEDINLWSVFYKDILPFYLPATRNQFLATTFDEIYNESKSSPTPTASNKKYQSKIINFNSDLEALINDANLRISNIYNEYLRSEDEDELEIKLQFFADDSPYNNTHDFYYLFYGKKRNGVSIPKKLYLPTIGLNIKEGVKEIHKPQTHFNEAKLTAIALAVRFACLPKNVGEGAFMALDDMLISLDMSNRMKVISYLLNIASKNYKIYVFTHDRLFYHTFKRIIETQYNPKVWSFGGLYVNDDKEPITPEYKSDNNSRIDSINEAYSLHDYFRCGTLLRQLCERCLKELLPSSYRSKEDSKTKLTIEKNLDEQILSLEDFCKHERIDFTPFIHLKSYKDLFLNSTAHNDITSPFYRREIKACKKALEELSKINRSKGISCNKDLSFQIDLPDDTHTIRLRLREENLLLLEYGLTKRISYYSKCEVLKDISKAGEIQVNEGFESLYEAYRSICGKYNVEVKGDLLDILKDRDGVLRDKL